MAARILPPNPEKLIGLTTEAPEREAAALVADRARVHERAASQARADLDARHAREREGLRNTSRDGGRRTAP
jgi:hypothetical protein